MFSDRTARPGRGPPETDLYRLHYAPGFSSMAPHMVLRHIGAPFELVTVDVANSEHHREPFLRLNPLGRIPVLEDGPLVLTESAAICLHLADKHSEAGLMPAVGSVERAELYRWLFYLSNTLQAEMFTWFYPDRLTDDGAAAAQVKAHAEARIAGMFDYLAGHLSTRGPNLCGDRFTVADPFLVMLTYWALDMKRPAREVAHLGAYLARQTAVVAIRAALDAESLSQPWF